MKGAATTRSIQASKPVATTAGLTASKAALSVAVHTATSVKKAPAAAVHNVQSPLVASLAHSQQLILPGQVWSDESGDGAAAAASSDADTGPDSDSAPGSSSSSAAAAASDNQLSSSGGRPTGGVRRSVRSSASGGGRVQLLTPSTGKSTASSSGVRSAGAGSGTTTAVKAINFPPSPLSASGVENMAPATLNARPLPAATTPATSTAPAAAALAATRAGPSSGAAKPTILLQPKPRAAGANSSALAASVPARSHSAAPALTLTAAPVSFTASGRHVPAAAASAGGGASDASSNKRKRSTSQLNSPVLATATIARSTAAATSATATAAVAAPVLSSVSIARANAHTNSRPVAPTHATATALLAQQHNSHNQSTSNFYNPPLYAPVPIAAATAANAAATKPTPIGGDGDSDAELDLLCTDSMDDVRPTARVGTNNNATASGVTRAAVDPADGRGDSQSPLKRQKLDRSDRSDSNSSSAVTRKGRMSDSDDDNLANALTPLIPIPIPAAGTITPQPHGAERGAVDTVEALFGFSSTLCNPALIAPLQDLLTLDNNQDLIDSMSAAERVYQPAPYYARSGAAAGGELDSSMRRILFDWMSEVAQEFQLGRETLYLAYNYVDRYLSIPPSQCQPNGCIAISKTNLQLLGITTLCIASKLEEIYAPVSSDFVVTADGAYTAQQMEVMERSVLKALDWKLLAQTPYSWLKLYVKLAVFIIYHQTHPQQAQVPFTSYTDPFPNGCFDLSRQLFELQVSTGGDTKSATAQTETDTETGDHSSTGTNELLTLASAAVASPEPAVAASSNSSAASSGQKPGSVPAAARALRAAAASSNVPSTGARTRVNAGPNNGADHTIALSSSEVYRLLYDLISVEAFSQMMSIIDLCALDIYFLRFYPSALAAAALLLTVPELASSVIVMQQQRTAHTNTHTHTATAAAGAQRRTVLRSESTGGGASIPAGVESSPLNITPASRIAIQLSTLDVKGSGGGGAAVRSSRGGRRASVDRGTAAANRSVAAPAVASATPTTAAAGAAAIAASAVRYSCCCMSECSCPADRQSMIWRVSGYTVGQLTPCVALMRILAKCPPKSAAGPPEPSIEPLPPAPYFDSKTPIEDVYTRTIYNPLALNFLNSVDGLLIAERRRLSGPTGMPTGS